MKGKQMHRSALPGGQTERRSLLERRVRNAFLNAPSALPDGRPEPRAAFDNAARRDNPQRPWGTYADALRNVAATAATRDGTVVLESRERIIDSILALAAYVLEPLDDGMPLDVVLYVRCVTEEAQALDAQSIARGLGTAEARAAAVRETEEAVLAARCYVAHERQQLQQAGGSIALVR